MFCSWNVLSKEGNLGTLSLARDCSKIERNTWDTGRTASNARHCFPRTDGIFTISGPMWPSEKSLRALEGASRKCRPENSDRSPGKLKPGKIASCDYVPGEHTGEQNRTTAKVFIDTRKPRTANVFLWNVSPCSPQAGCSQSFNVAHNSSQPPVGRKEGFEYQFYPYRGTI